MQRELYCSVCADKRHAAGIKYELENIVYRLKEIGLEEQYKYNARDFGAITMDNHSPHLMCGGACNKVSSSDFDMLNSKIHRLSIDLVMKIRNKEIEPGKVYEILTMFAGRYPNIYRVIERELGKAKVS